MQEHDLVDRQAGNEDKLSGNGNEDMP